MAKNSKRDFLIQDLSTFKVPKDFRGASILKIQLWRVVESTLFSGSPHFMFEWRSFLLRLFGAKIGSNVKIRSSVKFTYPWKVAIDSFVWIGDDCTFYSLGRIKIGSNTAIAHKVYFCAGSHDYKKSTFDIFSKDILVGSQVWIGNDVFIAPGVSIGNGSVIGARSSVFKNIPERIICYGNPAKIIKPRDHI